MLREKLMWCMAVALPLGMSAASIAVGVTCNTKDFGPNQACDASYAASTRCSHWTDGTCNTQQGVGDVPGPAGIVGCGGTTTNASKHCVSQALDCLAKFYCQGYGPGNAQCQVSGNAVLYWEIDPKTHKRVQKDAWLTQEKGNTACCTPGP